MIITYNDKSPYGQGLINLAGLVSWLQDETKMYTSIEVHDTLSVIAAEALRIRKQVDRSTINFDAVQVGGV